MLWLTSLIRGSEPDDRLVKVIFMIEFYLLEIVASCIYSFELTSAGQAMFRCSREVDMTADPPLPFSNNYQTARSCSPVYPWSYTRPVPAVKYRKQ